MSNCTGDRHEQNSPIRGDIWIGTSRPIERRRAEIPRVLVDVALNDRILERRARKVVGESSAGLEVGDCCHLWIWVSDLGPPVSAGYRTL